MLIEACVASVAQAVAAQRAGADRIELCGDGGTTPTDEVILSCLISVDIPVHVMIRPQTETFVVSPKRLQQMQREVARARQLGAHGVVSGALCDDGTVDQAAIGALIAAADGLPLVFHRAFDRTPDIDAALEALLALGVRGVLTSGGAASAAEGVDTLVRLQGRAGAALTVIAGGTVRASTVAPLIGCGVLRAIHARATKHADFSELVQAVRA